MTAAKLFGGKIVTEVVPAPTFFVAEDYHQEYFANNDSQPYARPLSRRRSPSSERSSRTA